MPIEYLLLSDSITHCTDQRRTYSVLLDIPVYVLYRQGKCRYIFIVCYSILRTVSPTELSSVTREGICAMYTLLESHPEYGFGLREKGTRYSVEKPSSVAPSSPGMYDDRAMGSSRQISFSLIKWHTNKDGILTFADTQRLIGPPGPWRKKGKKEKKKKKKKRDQPITGSTEG